MNPRDALNWLYSFEKFGSHLGLERITFLTKQLGNPQNSFKVIHVAGTNGKGSVCKFIASILQKTGYRTGVYLSPHLERFSERVVVNNEEISENNLVSLIEQVKPIVDTMITNKCTPTFFEIVTALAFLYFQEQNVEYAVIEVGLGGRLDATNIVLPLVSVITDISLEHTDVLGDTIRAIAHEKAGIIKDHVNVVTTAKQDAQEVIHTVAQEKHAPLTVIDKSRWRRIASSTKMQEFLIMGAFKEYHVKTSMLGEFQGENIALALAAIEQLQMNGVYITDNDIIEGIAVAFNPGRMEFFSEHPSILLDGAHNPGGMKIFRETLEQDFTYDHLILILGILKDKDISTMLATILPLADIVIVTKSSSSRACEPEVLSEMIKKLTAEKQVVVARSIPDAIEYAKRYASEKDLIGITGSLFTVGEARIYLRSHISKTLQHI